MGPRCATTSRFLQQPVGTAGRRASHCAVLVPGARSERSVDHSPAPQPRHPEADSRPPHPFPAKRLLQLALPFGSLAPAKPGVDCESPGGPRESCSPFLSLSQKDPRTPGPGRRHELRSLRSPARTLRAARVSSRLCLRRRAGSPGDAARPPESRPPRTAASAHNPPPAAGLRGKPLACAVPWLPAPGPGRPRRTFPCGAGERLRERPRPLRLPSSAAAGLPPAAAAGTVGPSQPPRPVRGPRSASRPRPTPPVRSAPGPPTGGGESEATRPGAAGGTATCDPLSSQMGRLTHPSAEEQSQPCAAPPCKANEVFRHCQSAPASVYPDSGAALSKGKRAPSPPGLPLLTQVSVGCPRQPGT